MGFENRQVVLIQLSIMPIFPSNTQKMCYTIYRSIKKVISLRNISKVFSQFISYIYGLCFTIRIIKCLCHFASVNHINL